MVRTISRRALFAGHTRQRNYHEGRERATGAGQFIAAVDSSKSPLPYSGFRTRRRSPTPRHKARAPVRPACRSKEGAPVPEFSPWHDNSFTSSSPSNEPARPAPSQRISEHPEFHSLRRAQRRFGVRATLLSVGGFLLYVLLSHSVPGLMNQRLLGHLTLGLALGLGQFVVMGVTAWCHVRHMRTRVDPLARGLGSRLDQHEANSLRSAAHRGESQPTVQPGSRGYRTW
ncbi:DUF485 domain-containing protein [Streptomyces sp. SD31]|uniref:DUF485 domain-containing protein n=1 Tax=Streptomyces sp. SD31 TaxID=3452208 RepID=UPI003F8A150F